MILGYGGRVRLFYVRNGSDGLNLLIDLDRLDDEAPAVAINELEAALKQLRRSEQHRNPIGIPPSSEERP